MTLILEYCALKRIQTGLTIFESQHNIRILIKVSDWFLSFLSRIKEQ
jgi:hypothetical protein